VVPFPIRVRPGENGSSICEGILLDITDRRSVEAALGDSTARNDAILAALPDLMFVMSREGRYLDYHARDHQALLLPPEAFMGKHMSEVLPPDLVKPFQRSFDQVFEAGGSAVVDYSLDINGERRYFEARVVATAPTGSSASSATSPRASARTTRPSPTGRSWRASRA
jgi:PAS domain-containing protein